MWTDTLFGRCQKSDSQTNFQAMAGARFTAYRDLSDEPSIYAQIVQSLATDERRNAQIAEDVRMALTDGRTPIVLTTLTSHVEQLGLFTFCILQECHHLSGHRIHEREAEKDGTVGSTSFRGTFGDCSNRTLCR